MVTWGEQLARHVQGPTREAFLRDALVQDAACRRIIVPGEAARRRMAADPGVEERHPELRPRDVHGARNRLVHEYVAVGYGIVWVAATASAPAMVEAARRVLAASAPPEGSWEGPAPATVAARWALPWWIGPRAPG